MEDSARRDLLNVMIFAASDGELSAEERQLIAEMVQELGLGQEEYRELVEEARQSPKRLSMPKEPELAEATLDRLVGVAAADGEINSRERRTLRRIFRLVGHSSHDMEDRLAAALGQSVDLADLDRATEELYAHFGEWDSQTRQRKVAELAGMGYQAVPEMVRILESYRTPENMPDAKALKTAVARQIGQTGDERAVYYLAQQAMLSDGEDDLTGPELREAATEAIGQIVGENFTHDEEGIEKMRSWWRSVDPDRYPPTV